MQKIFQFPNGFSPLNALEVISVLLSLSTFNSLTDSHRWERREKDGYDAIWIFQFPNGFSPTGEYICSKCGIVIAFQFPNGFSPVNLLLDLTLDQSIFQFPNGFSRNLGNHYRIMD